MSLSCLLLSLCYVGAISAWWFADMAGQKHLLVSSLVSGVSASLFAIVDLLPYWSSSVGTAVAPGTRKEVTSGGSILGT